MTNRDEIDALLTQIAMIMEDGTECLLSRTLDSPALAQVVADTCDRIDTMRALIQELRRKLDQLSVDKG